MGTLFALLSALLWASYNLAVLRGRDQFDPGAGYLLTLAMNAGATALFTLLPLPGAGAAGRSAAALACFVLAGLSTTLLGRWLYFASVYAIGPSRASAWKNASPAYTLLVGWLLLNERPGLPTLAGVVATVGGMLALARDQMRVGGLEGQGEASSGRPSQGPASGNARAGLLYGIGSALAFASGILLRKAGLNLWPDAAMGSAIGAWSALMGWLPVAVRRGDHRTLLTARPAGMRFFLLAGVFSSMAQLFIFLSLRLAPSAVAHAVSSLEPIFTVMLSRWLLHGRERLTRGMLKAVAVSTLGVVLVSIR